MTLHPAHISRTLKTVRTARLDPVAAFAAANGTEKHLWHEFVAAYRAIGGSLDTGRTARRDLRRLRRSLRP